MMYLKQSTSVDVGIGPFLDESDGKTAETGLTITQPDVRLKKNNGNWAQKAAAQTLSHEEAGWYELTLDATDTDTIGHLLVAIHESGALPVWREFHVLAANVYDSLFGAATDKLDVNVEEWNTTAVPSEHTAGYPIVTIKDGTGTGEINTNAGAVALVDAVTTVNSLAANTITASAIADNAIDAGAIAADAITAAKIADGAIDAATFAAGAINAAAIATDAITAAKIAADAIGASELAADAVAEIQSGLATAAALDTVDNFLDTEIADIQARLPAALVSGRIDASIGAAAANTITASALAADAVTEIQSGLATAAALDTVDNFIDTEIAAIKAKTDLIPGTIDGKTFSELVTLIAAVLLGKASGLATTTAVYRAVDDSKNRVTATVDQSGNRSAVTLDAS
jgi:hypothetical protein